MKFDIWNSARRPYYWWRDLLGTLIAGVALFGLSWYFDLPAYFYHWIVWYDSYGIVDFFGQVTGWQIVFGVSLLFVWLFSFRARFAERRLHAIAKERDQLQEEFSDLSKRYLDLNRANQELRRRSAVQKMSQEEKAVPSRPSQRDSKEVDPENITELLAGAIAMKQAQIPDGVTEHSPKTQTIFFRYLGFLLDQIPAMLEEEDRDGLQTLIDNIQNSASAAGVKAIAEKAMDVRKTLTGLHSKEIKKAQADLDALIALCREAVASPQK